MNRHAGYTTFNSYSHFLRERYGEKTYRVAVDAGFSCPNRANGRQSSGCSYCERSGSRAPYLGDVSELETQIASTVEFLKKRYGAKRFLLYFQAYSNTYAPADELKRIYDAGLAAGDFRGLVVSTRPDCLDETKADLLASYGSDSFDVWVELGLQSAVDTTLERVRRGHTRADFLTAYRLLGERGISRAVHLILGLPGEGLSEILQTAEFLADLNPEGVKIHNLHIPFDTDLYTEFLAGEIPAYSSERHLEYVIAFLERLPPETVVMRLTCDTPADRRAIPRRFLDKAAFYTALEEEMLRRNTRQGARFGTFRVSV